MIETHGFLCTADGGLSDGAKAVPHIRRHIESLPETTATFKRSEMDIPDHISRSNIKRDHMEFAGSWPVPDRFIGSNRRQRYVNPEHVHARKYTDAVVNCPCGARMVRGYSDVAADSVAEHDHADDCLPYHRLRGRADLAEYRHREVVRLGRLGWIGIEISTRIGAARGSTGSRMQEYGASFSDVRDEYRRVAAGTYVYLVRENGVSAKDVGEVYGHDPSTLGRWANEFLDYETDRVFKRADGQGGFRWQDPPSKRPNWLDERIATGD